MMDPEVRMQYGQALMEYKEALAALPPAPGRTGTDYRVVRAYVRDLLSSAPMAFHDPSIDTHFGLLHWLERSPEYLSAERDSERC